MKDVPDKETLESFWKPIFEKNSKYERNNNWLDEYEKSINIEKPVFNDITVQNVKDAMDNFDNWKSPGIDNIQNYWWLTFDILHEQITMIFNTLANDPLQIPEWFLTGRTTMVPKKEPTSNPGNYRPITCLPIIYKLLSKIFSNKIKNI